MKQFDFGQNWAAFSTNAATGERVTQACTQFAELMKGIELDGRSLLDIGFGQGFSLLSARALGADVVGCDINPKCHEVIQRNRWLFLDAINGRIPLRVGSILDNSTVDALRREEAAHGQGFDIVHSWGVLHRTGDMRRAIANAASLVRPGVIERGSAVFEYLAGVLKQLLAPRGVLVGMHAVACGELGQRGIAA